MKFYIYTFSYRKSAWLFILFISAIILNGCSTSTVEEHDDDGKLLATYQTKEGIKHGTYIGYNADGSIFEESVYVDGLVHGLRSLFYEGSKSIKTLETYEHGVMEGLFEEYHRNGKVAFTGMFVNDAMQGVYKKYNESGQLIEEVTFSDSEENGPFKEYHPNGQLAAEGGYLDGDNEHGILKIYDDQGQRVKEMDCNKGICRTTWSKEQE